jgi:hypothetical protein
MTDEFATATAKRLRAIEWSDQALAERRDMARLQLTREFLRRSANLATEVGGATKWPFFDIALAADPAVDIEPSLWAALQDHLDERVAFPVVAACRYALRWATLRDSGRSRLTALPDPFEPLILAWERGGAFVVDEARQIPFDHGILRVKPWQEHVSPVRIVALDPDGIADLDGD